MPGESERRPDESERRPDESERRPDGSERWSATQVLSLAPDASSQRAGRSLGTPGRWPQAGHCAEPPSVWGLCRGSARTPYQTCVDLAEPAYRCSCPSRKFPCKHALGLLLLWSDGHVPEAELPEWVGQWHAERADRRQRADARAARAATADPDAPPSATSVRTQARRADRVSGGVDELERWLNDQVRQGLAAATRLGYAHWDAMAARLVDAQAPGLASGVRRLASVASTPERLLIELSLLRLMVNGYRRRDDLPAGLAATVHTRIGFPTTTDEVLARDPVRDGWTVIGIRDELDERLNLRRVWLRGTLTQRDALVLSFARPGTPLPADLVLGTSFEADLCFFPGQGNLRALVRTRTSEPLPVREPPGAAATIGEAMDRYADSLAVDPWQERIPMLLGGVAFVAAGPTARPDAPWHVIDRDGVALPLNPWASRPWRMLAAAGGAPVTVAGEWNVDGLRPLAAWVEGRLIQE
jgi:SWIM zinc finger